MLRFTNVCRTFVEALHIVSEVAEHANQSMKYLVSELIELWSCLCVYCHVY